MEEIKKCINRRCNKSFSVEFKFCPYCGKLQSPAKKKRRRSNGAGSIYVRKENKKNPYSVYKTIEKERFYVGCYPTREAAERALLEYSPNAAHTDKSVLTLEKIYEYWKKSKSYEKLSESSKQGYNAAWLKLRTLKDKEFSVLKTSDYQKIIDYYENPHPEEGQGGVIKTVDETGKVSLDGFGRIKMSDGLSCSALKKIKFLVSQLCKTAMKDDIIDKNYGSLIELPSADEVNATRFTDVQLQKIKDNIGKIPYCDYIYALIYTNFRISEFLELTRKSYGVVETETGNNIPYLRGGKKTEAGRNRPIPIHPNIQEIVKRCVDRKGETIFCKPDGTPMNKNYFQKYCFNPAMEKLGFDGQGFTPHSCRRTFSTRMSAGGARGEDIAALMGHTDYEVDKKHYINQEIKTLYEAIQKMA